MAYNQPTCEETTTITGWSPNCSTGLGVVQRIVFTDSDFEFETEAKADDETQWGEDIVDKNIYPLPDILEIDDNSEAAGTYTSDINGRIIIVKAAKASYLYRFEYEPGLHARLRTFNGKSVRVIEIDTNNNVIGTTPDGVIFKGLDAYIYVGEKVAATSSTPAFTPVTVSYLSTTERDDKPAVFNVDWNILGLNGVQPVTLTVVGTPIATEIVVDVAGTDDGVAISGIGTNFRLIAADGTSEITISTSPESTTIPGRYTLTGTAFTTLSNLNIYDQTDGEEKEVLAIGNYYYQGTDALITFAE